MTMSTLRRTSVAFSIGLLLLGLLSSGCASSTSGKVYGRDEAKMTYSAYSGTVLEVEQVTIEGTQSGAGVLAGGALGGVAGSAFGKGVGRGLATVGGAIVGALGGAAAEKEVTTVEALEILVELDNGEVVSVVQEADQSFQPGDRVRVLRASDGSARVRLGAVPGDQQD